MKAHILQHIMDTIKVEPDSQSPKQPTVYVGDFEFVAPKHEQDPLAETLKKVSDTKVRCMILFLCYVSIYVSKYLYLCGSPDMYIVVAGRAMYIRIMH
jgi:hypothetical protein